MIDVIKLVRFSIFNICLIILIFLFSLSSNLRADSLDEILKLTFSSNKQLLLSRIKLQASKSAIDISKSALGLNFSASISGSKGWNINESSNNDSYSSSLIGSYNLLDGNFSKSKILIDDGKYTFIVNKKNDL